MGATALDQGWYDRAARGLCLKQRDARSLGAAFRCLHAAPRRHLPGCCQGAPHPLLLRMVARQIAGVKGETALRAAPSAPLTPTSWWTMLPLRGGDEPGVARTPYVMSSNPYEIRTYQFGLPCWQAPSVRRTDVVSPSSMGRVQLPVPQPGRRSGADRRARGSGSVVGSEFADFQIYVESASSWLRHSTAIAVCHSTNQDLVAAVFFTPLRRKSSWAPRHGGHSRRLAYSQRLCRPLPSCTRSSSTDASQRAEQA